ncbi:MAG: PEP-CTERM-box response regulator transcription factor [Alphaproteobacteria bacterium]|jgi:two-component system NtrC family response regulator|nr:PEP-CTERM-box response regulator transcription factor [Alphaproteobacteria bacterium]
MTQTDRTLLVVEDDPGLQRQLKWSFDGYSVVTASDRDSALSSLRRHGPPVVLLDLGLPPAPDTPDEGLAALEDLLTQSPDTKVIVVTGQDERENAVQAIGLGAYDFCAKPIDVQALNLIVDRAFRLHELENENRRLRERQAGTALPGIVTGSRSMAAACRMVERAAQADVTVLLLGESGTGKELMAKALHGASPRADRPFVAINCGAIPDNLLESELFGFEKGAFTGAVKQTLGRLELANHGTVFLDEIGDLPLSLQVKLLRFLQERIIERIGGRRSIPVDVRVVCATHQDLKARIRTGEFREDLFYRVSELVIDIPPLRDRDDDIVILANHFFKKYNAEQKRQLKGFSTEALAAMAAYSWPGNVRELENRVKRAVILADDRRIGPADLDLEEGTAEPQPMTLKEAREQADIRAIQQALTLARGNLTQTAKYLGVSRPTIYDLLRQYGIEMAAFKEKSADEGTGRTAQ